MNAMTERSMEVVLGADLTDFRTGMRAGDTELGRFSQKAERHLGRFDRAMARAGTQSARRLGTGMRRAGQDVSALTGQLARQSAALSAHQGALLREATALRSTRTAVLGLGAAYATLAGVSGLGGIVATSREFEKLRASLKTVTGSAEAGAEAFSLIEDFAKNTPFSVREITEAFIRLTSLGLEPSREALLSYSNTASATGKDLLQFAEAIADATTGEMERLKDFGITAKQAGDEVTFTFQQVSTTVAKNAAEIEGYLRSIGLTNFAGAAEEQMRGLNGALSTLEDSTARAADRIGRGGLADAVADAAREFADFADANQDAAEAIGGVLGGAVRGGSDALLALAENADIAAIAVGGLLTGRVTGALSQYSAGLAKAAVATRGVAVEAVRAAEADVAYTQAVYRSARATQQLAAQGKVAVVSLASATASVRSAGVAASAAQVQLAAVNAQLRATSVSALAARGAMTALSGTMAFFGGPVGLALTAVAVGIGYWATRTSEATAALEVHEGLIGDVRKAYEEADKATAGWADQVKAGTVTEAIANLSDLKNVLQDIRDEARAPVDAFGTDTTGVVDQIQNAVIQFKYGITSAKQFAGAIDDIAQANDNLDTSTMLGLLDIAGRAQEVESKVNQASAALRIIQGTASDADYALLGLADAANAAAGGIAASGNAASLAAGQYSTAAGAAAGYAGALQQLALAIPSVQGAARAQNQLAQAQANYNAAVRAADALPLQGLRDAAKGLAALSLDQAKRELSGFSKAVDELGAVENRVYLDSLAPKERALERVRQQHAKLADEIRAGAKAGLDAGEVDAALARNNEALDKALAGTAASFDKKAKSAGGSSKATKGAAKSLEEYRQIVDRAAEQEMPWLKAAKEADELRAALAALIATGEDVPEEIVVAVKTHIEKLDAQVAAKSTGKQAGEDFGSAFSSGFGDIFKDIFEGGIESFDDFLDKVTSKFADLAYQNIDNLFSGKAFEGLGGGQKSGLQANPVKGIEHAVQSGAASGTAVGSATGISAVFGGGAGGLLGAGGQALGTALGSFSLGYQSGSPIMGGIGGALSGLSGGLSLASGLGLAAGPLGILGAVVGGGLGILGGIMGGNAQRKAKRRQAQKELAGELGAIDQFKQLSYGRGIGDFRGDFTDYQDSSQKYQILARDAGNSGLQHELEDAHSQYFALLESTFRKERDTAMANLNLGFGFDTAFFDAIDNMESTRDELTGWVDDARFMFDRLRDFGHDLPQDEVNAYISEMEHAAQQYAISLVTGVEPMSDVAERINEIKGAAVGLQETLERLAMSSEDAAAAVDQALVTAMDKLRTEFTDELGRSINTLSGKGYLNDAADAVGQLSARLADAALLGVSGAQALQEFDLTIGDIAKSAAESLPAAERADVYRGVLQQVALASGEAAGVIDSLLMNALTDLSEAAADASAALAEGAGSLYRDVRGNLSDAMGIGFYADIEDALGLYNERLAVSAELGVAATGAFTELEYSLKGIAANSNLTTDQLDALAEVFPAISDTLGGLVGDGGSSGLADAQAAADQARSDLRAAYQAERSELEATLSALESFANQISIFRDNLRLDSSLSPLSPLDQLEEAARVYNETLDGVANGDQDAMGRLEQVSRDYLNEARAYYGSTEAYTAIFESVDQQLADALAEAGTQISVAEDQLAALEAQVGALIDINDGVLSVADAIGGLDGALGALAEAQAGQIAAIRELAGLQAEQQAGAINSLYQSLLGREVGSQGLGYWQDTLDQGGTLGDVASGISNSTEAAIRNLYLSILGREPDQTGLSGWGDYLAAGGTLQGVAQGLVNSPEAAAAQLPGMAGGGLVTGGIAGRDSVPVALMPNERVMTVPTVRKYGAELAAMHAGTYQANDNSALVAEVRALRGEMQKLQAVTAQGAQVTAAAAGETTRAVRDQGRGAGLARVAK